MYSYQTIGYKAHHDSNTGTAKPASQCLPCSRMTRWCSQLRHEMQCGGWRLWEGASTLLLCGSCFGLELMPDRSTCLSFYMLVLLHACAHVRDCSWWGRGRAQTWVAGGRGVPCMGAPVWNSKPMALTTHDADAPWIATT